jgi:hypothetical protein
MVEKVSFRKDGRLEQLQNTDLMPQAIQRKSELLRGLYPGPLASRLLVKAGAFDEKALRELGPDFAHAYWERLCKIFGLVAENGREGSGKRLQDMLLAQKNDPKTAVEEAGTFLVGALPGRRLMDAQMANAVTSHAIDECGHFSCIMDGDLARKSKPTSGQRQERGIVGDMPDYLADPLLVRMLLMLRQEHRESKGRDAQPYPTRRRATSETHAQLRDTASRGAVRRDYPHVASLLTVRNRPLEGTILQIETAERVDARRYTATVKAMDVLDGMNYAWSRLLENHPIEEAALLLDLFTHQHSFQRQGERKPLSSLQPALTACQVLRGRDDEPLKLKTLIAGRGAVLVVSQDSVDFQSMFSNPEQLAIAAERRGYRGSLPEPSGLSSIQREELMDYVIRHEAQAEGITGIPEKRMDAKTRTRFISVINGRKNPPKVELLVTASETQAHEYLGSDYQAAYKISEHAIPDRCTILLIPPALAANLKEMDDAVLSSTLAAAAAQGKSLSGALSSALSKGAVKGEATSVLSYAVSRGELQSTIPHVWSGRDAMRPEISAVIDYVKRLSTGRPADVKLQFGHIHSDRPPVKDQLMTAPLAKSVAGRLRENGISVELVTLVDNLHVPDIINYRSYAERLGGSGLAPERILLEDALPIAYLAAGICQKLMGSPSLGRRVRNLGGSVFMELDETNVTLYEGVGQEGAGGQGRVACVPFNCAFDFYLHNTKAIDDLFFKQVGKDRPDSEILKWHLASPDLSYHELVMKHVYSIANPAGREKVKERVINPLRPGIGKESADATPFVDTAIQAFMERGSVKTPVVAYVIEDFYLAQWDKYVAFFKAVSSVMPKEFNFDVVRIAVDGASGSIKPLSVKKGGLLREGAQETVE